MIVCSVTIAANGWSVISVIAGLVGAAIASLNQGISNGDSRSASTSRSQPSPLQPLTSKEVEGEPPLKPGEDFRASEIERVVASLKAGSSLLVIGKPGIGKTTFRGKVVAQLKREGYRTAVLWPAPAKLLLQSVCAQLDVDAESLEGKPLTIPQLKDAIAQNLSENPAFVICDDADKLTPSMRQFLEQLFNQGTPLLLVSNPVTPKDIFLKLPRLELQRLDNKAIRALASEYAEELEIELSPAQLSQIVARANGVPMYARRAVEEEHLGLDPSYDETTWIDGTPYLIVILLVFTLVRVVGKGTNNMTLAMIGMGLTIGVRIVQTLMYSLPRPSKKIGG